MGTSRIARWYRDRKTAHKLLLGFLAVAMLVGTVGVAGLAQLGAANGRLQGLYDASVDVGHVNDAREAFQRSRALVYRLLITPLRR